MKEALLTYEFTDEHLNIGDYIQSIAAKQFLNTENIEYIDREHLNSYSGDTAMLFMNGWFLMTPENFPPSKNIKPILLSHHINISVQEYFEKNKEILDFYKSNEPIGCRDYNTLDFLNKNNIKAFYTGCLTLTLGNTFKKKKESDIVYFVDARYKKFEKTFKNDVIDFTIGLFKYKTIKTIRDRFRKSKSKEAWIKTIHFYRSYRQIFTDDVLKRAEYVKHFIPADKFNSQDEIFKFGEDLLQKYANSNFVVTSRIHCALPGVAMGTPTLYVDIPDDHIVSDCRLNGIKEYFHVVKNENGILSTDLLGKKEKIGWNFTFKNKETFLPVKEKIEQLAKEKIAQLK